MPKRAYGGAVSRANRSVNVRRGQSAAPQDLMERHPPLAGGGPYAVSLESDTT